MPPTSALAHENSLTSWTYVLCAPASALAHPSPTSEEWRELLHEQCSQEAKLDASTMLFFSQNAPHGAGRAVLHGWPGGSRGDGSGRFRCVWWGYVGHDSPGSEGGRSPPDGTRWWSRQSR